MGVVGLIGGSLASALNGEGNERGRGRRAVLGEAGVDQIDDPLAAARVAGVHGVLLSCGHAATLRPAAVGTLSERCRCGQPAESSRKPVTPTMGSDPANTRAEPPRRHLCHRSSSALASAAPDIPFGSSASGSSSPIAVLGLNQPARREHQGQLHGPGNRGPAGRRPAELPLLRAVRCVRADRVPRRQRKPHRP